MEQIIVTKPEQLQQIVTDAVNAAMENRPVQIRSTNKEVFTNRQAMDYLNVSRSTLQRWRNDGLLPFRQVSGKILYKREDIEKLLQVAAK